MNLVFNGLSYSSLRELTKKIALGYCCPAETKMSYCITPATISKGLIMRLRRLVFSVSLWLSPPYLPYVSAVESYSVRLAEAGANWQKTRWDRGKNWLVLVVWRKARGMQKAHRPSRSEEQGSLLFVTNPSLGVVQSPGLSDSPHTIYTWQEGWTPAFGCKLHWH